MSAGEYLAGLLFFCVVFSSSLGVAFLLLRLHPALHGVEKWLGFGVLATAGLIAVHMVPGILGVLTRETVAITSILAVLGSWLLARRYGPEGAEAPASADDDGGPSSRLVWTAVAAAATAYGLAALLEIWTELSEPAMTVDTTTFHLPQVASWIREESLWGIHQFIPLQAHANYPHNGDVVHLATVLPWSNDAFARPIGWVYVALAAASAYALGRRLSGDRPLSALAAVLFASIPALILSTTSGALTDPILIGLYGAGLVFLLRHATSGDWSDLVLAGLGLGLAFGTKWYGISSVIATVALWGAMRLIAGRARRKLVVGQIAALTGVIAASGGFWLLRNWAGSDNPVFPVNLEAFGVTVFAAPADTVREQFGWSIFSYIGDLDLLTGPIADALWARWSVAGLLLLAAAGLATAVALPRRRRAAGSSVCFMLALVPLLLAVYVITPYTALGTEGDPFGTVFNVRYSLPAMIAAVGLLPWLGRRFPFLALPLAGAALVGIGFGIREGFEPSRSELALIALAAGAAALAYAATSRTGRGVPFSPRTAAIAGSVVLVGAAMIAYDRQQAFNDDRYEQDPALAWIAQNAPEGKRVGLDGEWTVTTAAPVLPAFGPRLDNEVEYVGSLESGFLEPYSDERSWRRAVESAGYDLIVIGRLKPGRAERVSGWAYSAGYRLIARSPNLLLMAKDEEPQPLTARAASSPSRTL